jgi:hypothetical protein
MAFSYHIGSGFFIFFSSLWGTCFSFLSLLFALVNSTFVEDLRSFVAESLQKLSVANLSAQFEVLI